MPEKLKLTLVLASGSPRRRELLAQIGFNSVVRVADVDETPLSDESSVALVERLAQLKGASIVRQADEVVIAADTIVSIDGESLGKPTDKQHGIDMLMSLSGRRHEVVTGVCIRMGEQMLSTTVTTGVNMAIINHVDAQRYWEGGEPSDKAGAYAIQGYGAVFVTSIEGSYSNVVGLPLHETAQMIKQLGCCLDEFNNHKSSNLDD